MGRDGSEAGPRILFSGHFLSLLSSFFSPLIFLLQIPVPHLVVSGESRLEFRYPGRVYPLPGGVTMSLFLPCLASHFNSGLRDDSVPFHPPSLDP